MSNFIRILEMMDEKEYTYPEKKRFKKDGICHKCKKVDVLSIEYNEEDNTVTITVGDNDEESTYTVPVYDIIKDKYNDDEMKRRAEEDAANAKKYGSEEYVKDEQFVGYKSGRNNACDSINILKNTMRTDPRDFYNK